jgi:hypothetical protein
MSHPVGMMGSAGTNLFASPAPAQQPMMSSPFGMQNTAPTSGGGLTDDLFGPLDTGAIPPGELPFLLIPSKVQRKC